MKFITRIRAGLKAGYEGMKYGGINTIQIQQVVCRERLKNKNILITGGGSGIGFAIAKKSVESGANVIITGRFESKLTAAAQELDSPFLKYMLWDLTDISQMREKAEACRKLFGSDIDILVNNAGVQPHEFFPDVTEAEWDKIYNTNSKGTFFISESICKYWMCFKENDKYKKIINIDSQGGFVGATYPYRMTKWDIRGLTAGLGLKMAPYGILVNGIAPGVVKTAMQEFSLKQNDNYYCNQNPLKRIALPEEIAELAVFMMSDACNFMVGQTVLIDGGFSLI